MKTIILQILLFIACFLSLVSCDNSYKDPCTDHRLIEPSKIILSPAVGDIKATINGVPRDFSNSFSVFFNERVIVMKGETAEGIKLYVSFSGGWPTAPHNLENDDYLALDYITPETSEYAARIETHCDGETGFSYSPTGTFAVTTEVIGEYSGERVSGTFSGTTFSKVISNGSFTFVLP